MYFSYFMKVFYWSYLNNKNKKEENRLDLLMASEILIDR